MEGKFIVLLRTNSAQCYSILYSFKLLIHSVLFVGVA